MSDATPGSRSGPPDGPTGEGWPRVLRLRAGSDFARVQSKGRRIRGSNLVILYLANGTASPRFGLSVSRKVGNAVVRNRVKRWLRESLRKQRAGLGGVDVVVIARPPAATAGYPALYEEIGSALRTVGGVAG